MKQIAYLKDKVKGTQINAAYIRATPNGKVIASMERGEWVDLTGAVKETATTSWTEVVQKDGTKGWVASRLLDVHAHPDPAPPAPPAPCFPPTEVEIPTPDTQLFRNLPDAAVAVIPALLVVAGIAALIVYYLSNL